MEDSDDTDNPRQLFPGLPEDKRVGILRTFHHKMYEDQDHTSKKNKGLCQTFYEFYFEKNKGYCMLVLISFALVLIGILSMIYGFMLPPMYHSLENEHSPALLIKQDRLEAVKEKDIFLVASIGLISFGLISAALCLFVPVYQDSGKLYDEDSIIKTPILVDYELAPYRDTLKGSKNYAFDDSSDWTPSPSASPTDNVSFTTFYIQQGESQTD